MSIQGMTNSFMFYGFSPFHDESLSQTAQSVCVVLSKYANSEKGEKHNHKLFCVIFYAQTRAFLHHLQCPKQSLIHDQEPSKVRNETWFYAVQ